MAHLTGTHPGPRRAALPAVIRDAVVAHARAEHPNEACGLIAGSAPAADGGIATTWHAARNRAASPTDVDLAFYPDALYLLVSLAESEADPATGAESVRAWRIVDGAVFEVALIVVGG